MTSTSQWKWWDTTTVKNDNHNNKMLNYKTSDRNQYAEQLITTRKLLFYYHRIAMAKKGSNFQESIGRMSNY